MKGILSFSLSINFGKDVWNSENIFGFWDFWLVFAEDKGKSSRIVDEYEVKNGIFVNDAEIFCSVLKFIM